MTSYQDVFTPIFIIVALFIFIVGIIILQVLNKIFAGSQNLATIRIFCICIIINIVILVFLIMSFSKIKVQRGPNGPDGNKGLKGSQGDPGGLVVCSLKYQTIEEKKALEKSLNYLDLKPPLLNTD